MLETHDDQTTVTVRFEELPPGRAQVFEKRLLAVVAEFKGCIYRQSLEASMQTFCFGFEDEDDAINFIMFLADAGSGRNSD